MAQVLEKELSQYWGLLDNTQKKSILTMIKSFLQPKGKSSHTTIAQYNHEIDQAMNRIDRGEGISHEVVAKEMAKW